MKDPTRVRVLKAAEDLAVEVYRVTGAFPSVERFGLTSQMRRAAVSVGSNIAEGCGMHGDRAFVAYLHRSLGSGHELEFQARLAVRLGYANAADLDGLAKLITSVCKMLSRLIVALR
jgi:four helix bundle protein